MFSLNFSRTIPSRILSGNVSPKQSLFVVNTHLIALLYLALLWKKQNSQYERGRCGGLMVSVPDSGSSGPNSSPGRGTCSGARHFTLTVPHFLSSQTTFFAVLGPQVKTDLQQQKRKCNFRAFLSPTLLPQEIELETYPQSPVGSLWSPLTKTVIHLRASQKYSINEQLPTSGRNASLPEKSTVIKKKLKKKRYTVEGAVS